MVMRIDPNCPDRAPNAYGSLNSVLSEKPTYWDGAGGAERSWVE